MTKFYVLAEEIKAALLFAPQDDSRYVLNSVCFEVRAGQSPKLISTDGRRLTVIDSQAPQDGCKTEEEKVILGRDFLKLACLCLKSKLHPICIEFHPPKRVVFSIPGTALDIEDGGVIEADYPAWRGIIPTGPSNPLPRIAVNASYVGDYAKAAKFIRSGCIPAVQFRLYDDGKAMEVRIDGIPNFYGVIMPCRIQTDDQFQPNFLKALCLAEEEEKPRVKAGE